ncbi:hypothetical protein K440DRAFT_646973 [Wilcoxina mikolae CBS 423.85]|nr:hypothetical protein K440DRAFT_646973 [Wilcoxina mikolae CBS 423.85]
MYCTWRHTESANSEAKMHLKSSLQFLEREIGNDKFEAEKLRESNYISFRLLWTIFRPGDLVLEVEDSHPRLFRFISGEYGTHPSSGEYFELQLSCTANNGVTTGRLRTSKITSLSIFPLKFLDEQESVKVALTARGEKYLSLQGNQVYRYKGQLRLLHKPPDMAAATCAGRIIIDAKTFDIAPHCTKPNWKDDDPILCPPYVHGFFPRMKQWARFFVDEIEPPSWNTKAFDKNLILPDTQKKVIRSLVGSHQFPADDARNQNESKGKGLVILLHGSPGTVSEYSQRVLLVVSSGTLGKNVEQIDKNLSSYLQWAALWKSIILIDEADVFWKPGNPDPLAVASSTTVWHHNPHLHRVEGFDPAVISRIHISLPFYPPGAETRQHLWEQMLGRLATKDIGYQLRDVLPFVTNIPMNGREISNAVNTIRTLAREENR